MASLWPINYYCYLLTTSSDTLNKKVNFFDYNCIQAIFTTMISFVT